MNQKARIVTAVTILLFWGVSARAIDASCVGVQTVAAKKAYDNLSPAQQEEFRPVMERIAALQAATAASLAEPEAALARYYDNIRARMPGASEQQIAEAFFQDLRNSGDVDAAYAKALAVEFKIHGNEALQMAGASRLPVLDDGRVAALAQAYADRRLTPELGSAAEGNPMVKHLAVVTAVGEALLDLGPGDLSSQRLASGAAQWGWDKEGRLPAVAVQAVRDVARSVPATQALGARGVLRLGHQATNLGPAETRRALMEPGKTKVGHDAARQAAGGLNDLHRFRAAAEAIARSVPREPPPPPAQREERRAWTERVVEQARAVVKTVKRRIGAPDLLEAAGVTPQ
jgi:hypothetical protein